MCTPILNQVVGRRLPLAAVAVSMLLSPALPAEKEKSGKNGGVQAVNEAKAKGMTVWSGKVVDVDKNAMTLSSGDFQKRIEFSDSTRVIDNHKVVHGSTDSLTSGQEVRVSGRVMKDGTLKAERIEVSREKSGGNGGKPSKAGKRD